LAAVLLLPVPVFAFSWAGPWSISASNATVTTAGDSLSITPTSIPTSVSVTATRDFNPTLGFPIMSANVQTGPTGLTLTGNSGTMDLHIWASATGQTTSEIIPSEHLAPTTTQVVNNQFGQGSAQLQSGVKYTLHIFFQLNGTWSMPGSTTTIVTNLADGSP
jgi:hypothetical protein